MTAPEQRAPDERAARAERLYTRWTVHGIVHVECRECGFISLASEPKPGHADDCVDGWLLAELSRLTAERDAVLAWADELAAEVPVLRTALYVADEALTAVLVAAGRSLPGNLSVQVDRAISSCREAGTKNPPA